MITQRYRPKKKQLLAGSLMAFLALTSSVGYAWCTGYVTLVDGTVDGCEDPVGCYTLPGFPLKRFTTVYYGCKRVCCPSGIVEFNNCTKVVVANPPGSTNFVCCGWPTNHWSTFAACEVPE